jgi:membrane-associated phospholipid phosphatase
MSATDMSGERNVAALGRWWRNDLAASPLAGVAVGGPLLLLLGAVAAQATRLDLGIFMTLNRLAAQMPDWVWQDLTVLGDSGVLLCMLAPALLLRPQWLMAALTAVPLAALFSFLMKSLFHGASRPGGEIDPTHFHLIGQLFVSNSFPSGHSIAAFAVAAAILAVDRQLRCIRLAAALIVVAAAIAFSRVAVGAHWPVDVVAGAAGGWLCGVLGAVWVRRFPGVWLDLPWRNGAAVIVALSAAWIANLDLGYALAQPLRWGAVACAVVAATWHFLSVGGRASVRRPR